MTGRDLVTASLRLIGAAAPGESVSATEATDGLATLNRMISGFSNEKLMIYAKVREEFTLTANDGIYSMGSSGDFNTSRPQWIESATLEDQSQSPDVEIPIKIIRNASEWAEIISKDATSTYPRYLFNEKTYPTDTINLYPIPTAANKLVLYSVKPLTEISTLDTSVSVPAGYEECLIYNLAMRLAPEYGKQPSELVMMTAIESKASIKRVNHKPSFLKVDNALINSGVFDINTGEN